MWWYCNEATFATLLVAASFSECYTADFAFQILSCIFLKKAFSRSFFMPHLDFYSLVLSVFYQIWLSYLWKAVLQTYWGFFIFDEYSWWYSRLNFLQNYAVAMATQFAENQNRSIGL